MARMLPLRRGFDGSPVQRFANGTALEPESLAYADRGAQLRRGRALFPDGAVRSVRAGIADTYFSIPAHARIGGRYVAGFLSVSTIAGYSTATDDDPAVLRFTPYNRYTAAGGPFPYPTSDAEAAARDKAAAR